ncbi:MAG: Single-stranded-DNA-specific exonuclease RecJ [Acidobacteria bacterium ADurb.Bin340]|nr:MAG: Single-stranded-DNA-specific exonuclease RecJ [Acidobacteria bacterium ADurb.Bin340]
MTGLSWRLRRSLSGPRPWQRLAEATGLEVAAARLAWLRGDETPEDLAWRLDGSWARPWDPGLLQGIDAAVARIRKAIQNGERIVVYGDYDADGVTATALLVRTLERLGARPSFFIPNRFSDGYGLSLPCIRELAQGGPGLVISVDCGVRSVAEVEASRALGLEWVITDHHALGSELPQAVAVVHPALGAYPNPALAGVGVAFKLAQALLDAVPVPTGAEAAFLRGLLKLVALGTVADMVPLRGENAWLVRQGLQAMGGANGPGLQALLASARVEGVPRASAVAFGLGPRLNAVGRMGGAEDAVRLLLTRDAEEAQVLADRAETLNLERRALQEAFLARLPEPGDEAFELLVEAGAHKGVLGIVAGQRMRRTGRPTAVGTLEDGLVQCSCRAPEGFDLTELLERARPWLSGGGGHRSAAGMSFPEASLPFVRRALATGAREQAAGLLAEVAAVDGEGLAEVPSPAGMAALEPFGMDYPEPVFAVSGRAAELRPFKEIHLRFRLKGLEGRFTWFSAAGLIREDEMLTVAVAPEDHPRWGRSWRVAERLGDPA